MMKSLFWIALAALAVLAFAVTLVFQGRASAHGAAPGLSDGRLARCPERPNCVGSEYPDDVEHVVEPLRVAAADRDAALAAARRAVEELGGEIVSDAPGYIAATFTSRLFGFVDDVELRADAGDPGTVQVRSASRVGYSDLGANRKRVQALRRALGKR